MGHGDKQQVITVQHDKGFGTGRRGHTIPLEGDVDEGRRWGGGQIREGLLEKMESTLNLFFFLSFFFFLFTAAKFPGQGSNQNCSCSCYTTATARATLDPSLICDLCHS